MLVADVAHLARTQYSGVNHTHLAELLAEREGIHIGRTTLRRVLLEAGLSSPRRRRPPKHRVRRQRMPREGMLIQMDGSHHPWLGEHTLPFTLLIAVDDATGTAVSAWFCEQEDSHNYFLLIRALVERRGVPVALYTDRHGVFKYTPGAGLPAGPTQFSRAMDELGIQMIFAQSPQAKGRVERTAGTFQDRSCVSSTAARWTGTTRCGSSCVRPSYAGATVEVLEGLEGQLSVRHEGRIVAAQEAPPDPVSLRNGHPPSADPPVPSIGVNHWDERWAAHLMPFISSQEPEADEAGVTNGELAAMPPLTVVPRKPTFLQKERWKAVQKARRKGMSLRAIERDLGIPRSTIRNYLEAGGPRKRRSRTVPISPTSGTMAT